MRIKTKVVALMLTLVFILSGMPLSVFAGNNVALEPETCYTDTSENLSELGYTEQTRNSSSLLPGDLTAEQLKTAVLSSEDIPEVVTAKQVEENGHVNRLYEQETDLNTVIFQNRDGSKTAYIFAKAIKYIDESGKVRDKSTSISAISGSEKYSYGASDNNIKTYYSGSISDGITLSYENYTIEFYPNGEYAKSAGRAMLGSSASKSDNKSTNRINYNNAFGNGVTLQYTPCISGVKEDIILSSYTGVNEFSFTYKTNGLTIVKESGIFCLIDSASGTKVGTIGDIICFDSNEKKQKISIGKMEVSEIKAGEEYLVTVIADVDFLTDEETVYPVYIDPPISLGESVIKDKGIYRPESAGAYLSTNMVALGTPVDISGCAVRMLYGITDSSFLSNININTLNDAYLCAYSVLGEYAPSWLACPYNETWTDGGIEYCSSETSFNNYTDVMPDTQGNEQFIEDYVSYGIYDTVYYWLYEGDSSLPGKGFVLISVDGEGDPDCYGSYGWSIASVENVSYTTSIVINYASVPNEFVLNNKDSGKFLTTNSSYDTTHDIYADDGYHKWIITYDNGAYKIVSSNDNNKILCCPTSTSLDIESLPGTLTDNYKWIITAAEGGGYIIKNAMYIDNVLYDTGSAITIHTELLSNDGDYDKSVWRKESTTYYFNLDDFSLNCVSTMNTLSSTTCHAVAAPSYANFIDQTDFEWSSSNTSVISVSPSGSVTAGSITGYSTITAVHKPTGETHDITISVDQGPWGSGTEYYINNVNSGMYFTTNSSFSKFEATYNGTDYQKWMLQCISGNQYTIVSSYDTSRILCCPDSTGFAIYPLPVTTSDKYIWNITEVSSGQYIIKNAYSNKVLYRSGSGSIVSIHDELSSEDDDYYNSVWRLINLNDMEPLTGFSINRSITMDLNTSQICSISQEPYDACPISNSEVTWSSSNTSILTISPSGVISAGSQTGTCTITATHNTYSNMSDSVDITVSDTAVTIITDNNNSTWYKETEYANSTSGTNNTANTAEIAINSSGTYVSDKVILGKFTATDSDDYYKIYLVEGQYAFIKLSRISSDCNFNLHVYNVDGSILLDESTNSADMGEFVEIYASDTGYYYIQVDNYSSSLGYYNLYIHVPINYQLVNQSFYIYDATSSEYMYKLGRDQTDNTGGYVYLCFNVMAINDGVNGIRDFSGNFVPLVYLGEYCVWNAVNDFIDGYSSNPNHTNQIKVVVTVNDYININLPYALPNDANAHEAHGAQFKTMLLRIEKTSLIHSVTAGLDFELDYNTLTNADAWVSGFDSTSIPFNMYILGALTLGSRDFSGDIDPYWDQPTNIGTYRIFASTLYNFLWGDYTCTQVFPQTYNSSVKNWLYLSKWKVNHSSEVYQIVFTGIMSTNGFNDNGVTFFTLQESITNFDSYYNTIMGTPLETYYYVSWIVLSNIAQRLEIDR